MRYYHVAGSQYTPGEPLLSYSRLVELGVDAGWQWYDADGIAVRLFLFERDARAFARTYGGSFIVSLDIDIFGKRDFGQFPLPGGGSFAPRLVTVDGCLAVADGIPAEWIVAAEPL